MTISKLKHNATPMRLSPISINLAYNDVGNVLFMSPHEPISVTVDVIISNNGGDVLFIKRKFPPFQDAGAARRLC